MAPPEPAPGLERFAARPRRRTRRRRVWYRRPLIVAPVALFAVALAVVGFVTYRAESAITKLHDVSTPPPVVADATIDEDPIWQSIEIETEPAREAIAAAGSGAEGADGGGGIFDRVQDASSNVTDLANGAAVAAGVRDAPDRSRTILIMGVDARPGAPIDIAVRPDALMVLHLDRETRSCRLLAIPRDTRAHLPGYGQTKINHALMVGGIPYQRLVVEDLLGIEIDSYALIDFVGFQKLVDVVGGVPIDVPAEIIQNGQVTFTAGPHIFDGDQALAYARFRGDPTGDIGRIHRQWAVLRGLVEVESGRNLARDINDVLPAIEDHLRTDLTASDFAGIAQTYSGRCTTETTDTFVLEGTGISLPDPMLQQPLYYNAVNRTLIQERVNELLGTDGEPPAPGDRVDIAPEETTDQDADPPVEDQGSWESGAIARAAPR